MIINRPAVGVKLPIGRSQTGYFNQSFSIQEQVQSNLTNLILTHKGERLMQPEFGCNIHALLFNPNNEDIVTGIQEEIQDAVGKWLPYVQIAGFDIKTDPDNNTVYVKVDYSIDNLPGVVDSLVVAFNP